LKRGINPLLLFLAPVRKKLIEMLGPMSDFIDISIIFVDDIPASNIGKINLVDQRLDIREFIN